MNIGSQRRRVARISARATAKKAEMSRRGREIHRWNQDTFGRLDALALLFAAGALWAATAPVDSEEGKVKRAVLGLTNAALITSRLLNHAGAVETDPGV